MTEVTPAPAEALSNIETILSAAAEVINAVPGRLRDRPDYITHIPCDVACRLLEAAQMLTNVTPDLLAALARAEAAEAEVKRLREAGGALADRWDAEYMTLGPEDDYEESGGYLKAQGYCADELRAALAGSPS